MSIKPQCKVKHVKALGILLEVDLVIAFGKVSHDKPKAFSIVKESSVE
jgi:hypothetical protein